MKDYSKIKLLIWDLDRTFWNGTLNDNDVEIIEDNIRLVRNMTDAGVICSICSKNDSAEVDAVLKELGLEEYFVFRSVNWSPKGERIKQIISEMQLRPVNVAFIDDNNTNLAEAKASVPDIILFELDEIPSLIEYFEAVPKKDMGHARLKQYHVLEKKKEFRALSGSNDEFLKQCNIKVEIKKDCENHKERLLDLINRSNQLNFTKVRLAEEAFSALLDDDNIECGYANVWDSFGDYGIVGFYAIKDGRLEHFVFSCRTLGMGIEQYVYNVIGRPELTVIGEVASDATSEKPDWINMDNADSKDEHKKSIEKNGKVILKGPCDLQIIFSFITESKNILSEFVYIGRNGVSIEGGNHTMQIVESLSLDDKTKDTLIDLPFGDLDMFTTAIFDDDVSYVVLSMLTDPNLGLYRNRENGGIVAFGEYVNDLTNEKRWVEYINGEVFLANAKFSEDDLKKIKKGYEFLGRITPEETVKNLDYIYSRISPNAQLILLLGSEKEYESNMQESYADRHQYHKELNSMIFKWMEDKERAFAINITEYIKSEADYTNNINHFAKHIYYEISKDIVEMISMKGIRQRNKLEYAVGRYTDRAKNKLKRHFGKR